MSHEPGVGVAEHGAARLPDLVPLAIGGGVLNVPYRVDDGGRVIVDGDMVLGHVDEVFPVADGVAMSRVNSADWWPSSVINYEIDTTTLDTAQIDQVEEAMDLVTYYTPIRFRSSTTGPRVVFEDTSSSPGCSAGSSTATIRPRSTRSWIRRRGPT